MPSCSRNAAAAGAGPTRLHTRCSTRTGADSTEIVTRPDSWGANVDATRIGGGWTTFVVGLVLVWAGVALRQWAVWTLGRFFTWQVIVRRDHELVTSGPYAFVRHPSYTGWLLMVAGNYLTLFNPHSYFSASGLLGTLVGRLVAGGIVLQHANVAASMMGRVAQEDAMLQKTFGDRWEEWARRTPCRLIPFIY